MAYARRPRRRFFLIGIPVVAVALLAGGLFIATPFLERLNVFIVPPTPQHYAAIAVENMRAGLLADAATSEAVARDVEQRVATATSYTETYQALAEATTRLGGEHSSFLTADEAAEYFGSGSPSDEPSLLPAVTTAGGVTTVTLPTLVGADTTTNQRYIDAAVDGIAAAASHTTVGWIVDLRDNHGGNVWPMLAAASPLLSDGRILSFEYVDRSDAVTIDQGSVSLRGQQQAAATHAAPKTTLPIAVLINGMTGSSAEAVAIGFVGQPNVSLFGQPSYGFSTVNEPRRLYDGATINLTVAVDADRNGTRYGTPVIPDHAVEDARSAEDAARDWLTAGGR